MVARAFVRVLRRSDHPVIVNVSSESGSLARKTTGRNYGYCASKAALNMLTRTLAHDTPARWDHRHHPPPRLGAHRHGRAFRPADSR